jgi:hypothetical protein
MDNAQTSYLKLGSYCNNVVIQIQSFVPLVMALFSRHHFIPDDFVFRKRISSWLRLFFQKGKKRNVWKFFVKSWTNYSTTAGMFLQMLCFSVDSLHQFPQFCFYVKQSPLFDIASPTFGHAIFSVFVDRIRN